MKLDESYLARRRFLGGMICGGVAALGAGAAVPLIGYVGNLRAEPPPDYLSHFGLCLGLVGGRPDEAIRACRRAVAQERANAELWRNLGRSLVAARRREEAFYAFQCGLDVRPGDPAILRELSRMGVRERPVLPLLSRRNRLNIVLGKTRRRLLAD